MSQPSEPPPSGVEVMPDDVSDELDRVEMSAHKKLVQKIMDDPEFGKRLQDDPAGTLSDESLAEELGLVDEVAGHRWPSSWRYHWYYGWVHWHRRRRWHYHA